MPKGDTQANNVVVAGLILVLSVFENDNNDREGKEEGELMKALVVAAPPCCLPVHSEGPCKLLEHQQHCSHCRPAPARRQGDYYYH